MVKISSSILSKQDNDTINKLNYTDTDYLHIDVMDGKFVSNEAFSINRIEEISNISSNELDIHLMVKDIDSYMDKLISLKPSFITIHYEVLNNIDIIDKIRSSGIKCGISVKPNTDIKNIFCLLNKIDLVLIMSVEPGMGGQSFLPHTLDKIKLLKQEINDNKYNVLISVDGGINEDTAKLCINNGADILVAGIFITDSNDFQKQITILRNN